MVRFLRQSVSPSPEFDTLTLDSCEQSIWKLVSGVFFICAVSVVTNDSVRGQGAGLGLSLGVEPQSGGYPSPEYYAGLEIYRTGELDRAFDAFEVAISRTRRDINGHWIDAIPVYAMMAECQYHVGDLEGAMESVDTALKIAIRYRGWLQRPQWDDALRAQVAFSPKQYLWPEANAVNRLPLNRNMRFTSGEMITEQRLALGGRLEELNIKSIDVVEVLRGLAIASYRRRIILGPLTEGDPLSTGVLDSTKYPADLQIPIGRNLIGSLRAAERFGAMNDQRSIEDAAKYATFNGGVHPLSPVTNLCAASALAGTDKAVAAVPICLAAANQAAAWDQFEWTGEALQLAAGCATAREAPAVQHAGQVAAAKLQRESRLASLHCLLASADAAVTAGDLQSAMTRLTEARSISVRRDVVQPRLDTYGAYIMARIATRNPSLLGQPPANAATPWDEPLSAILRFATNNRLRKRNLISMPRLYQLQRVRLSLGRNLSGQSADQLLARYALPPSIDVWRRDPVDAVAGSMAERESLRIARFRTAASRESALDVMLRLEDIQSGRFHQQLPLGGRVFQARSVARLPDRLLEKSVVQWRNKAAKPIRDLRSSASQPLPPDPPLAESVLTKMEMNAWSIALDRHDLPTAVPHSMDQKRPAGDLPDNVGILAFFQDGTLLHGILITKKKSSYWRIKGASRVGASIAKVMRGIGASKNRAGRLPTDDSWRNEAIGLRDRLIMTDTGAILEGPLAGIEHLVVVPDALLWYLPFEILPTGETDSKLLGDAIRISYAASPALAMYPTSEKATNPVIAVASGKFFAPRDSEANQSAVQSIVDAISDGNAMTLPGNRVVATSMLGNAAGHIVIGEPTTPASDQTLDWPLSLYEASLSVGRLRAWLGFPSHKPSSVMLSGFRSNLDTNRPVSGAEIFLTVSALQQSGVRDLVLSRWAVGGESTAILLREYVQELPFIGAGAALARAKSVLRKSELAPSREPTLVGNDLERETLTGNEPFFWSTYMHVAPIGMN